jgi:hypothetical protein
MNAIRFAPQTIWIKAQSGETYLCPAWMKKDASEEELRKHCVSESQNPQNN